MAVIGKLLKNKRAGEARMAWNLPMLAGPETLRVTSEAFGDGEAIPLAHAAKMAGGAEQSPPLSWNGVPDGAAQVLLVPVRLPGVRLALAGHQRRQRRPGRRRATGRAQAAGRVVLSTRPGPRPWPPDRNL